MRVTHKVSVVWERVFVGGVGGWGSGGRGIRSTDIYFSIASHLQYTYWNCATQEQGI